ncbi:hypothetical protein [Staphylococcus chromogenes]|uniref:hypothetical protein n=1 Tax=Staphylococcus chromogenes TaxID=46126 RepID=UPI001648FEBA|nr:hypothetical protein [Staphylococcus chromogenes]
MIVNVSGEEEPNSNETLEQRLANVENEVKNLKSRVEILEDDDSGDDSEKFRMDQFKTI